MQTAGKKNQASASFNPDSYSRFSFSFFLDLMTFSIEVKEKGLWNDTWQNVLDFLAPAAKNYNFGSFFDLDKLNV